MRVVSNAGPLIALGKLGQLGLLLKLYDEILISREVYNEVVVNGLLFGAFEAQTVEFLVKEGHIQVADVNLPSPLPLWAQPIDSGEIETIILAQQLMVDWVLIDNMHARKAAHQVGLSLKGTVGLLLEAFRHHYLSLLELELLLQNIKSQPEFWISEHLCDQALAQARREARQRPTTLSS